MFKPDKNGESRRPNGGPDLMAKAGEMAPELMRGLQNVQKTMYSRYADRAQKVDQPVPPVEQINERPAHSLVEKMVSLDSQATEKPQATAEPASVESAQFLHSSSIIDQAAGIDALRANVAKFYQGE